MLHLVMLPNIFTSLKTKKKKKCCSAQAFAFSCLGRQTIFFIIVYVVFLIVLNQPTSLI